MTDKGRKILKRMSAFYRKKTGDPKKAEEVFYASRNKGTITGVDRARKKVKRWSKG